MSNTDEWFTERDYKRLSIMYLEENHDNFFEDGISESIKHLKGKIALVNNTVQELLGQIEDAERPTERDLAILSEANEHEGEGRYLGFNLYALNEMRIIYMYKNLEISLKAALRDAYPNVKPKAFSQWEFLVSFLGDKEIALRNIEGYTEAEELRHVNNNLKHSDIVQTEVEKINEFSSGFSADAMEQFALRVRLKVETFRGNLLHEIAKERYDFDEARLDQLVSEFKHRMDKETLQQFIQKLGA